jgi:hypothetical protein
MKQMKCIRPFGIKGLVENKIYTVYDKHPISGSLPYTKGEIWVESDVGIRSLLRNRFIFPLKNLPKDEL